MKLATRKYTTLLKKEQDKCEIQEGLIKACDVIDLNHRKSCAEAKISNRRKNA